MSTGRFGRFLAAFGALLLLTGTLLFAQPNISPASAEGPLNPEVGFWQDDTFYAYVRSGENLDAVFTVGRDGMDSSYSTTFTINGMGGLTKTCTVGPSAALADNCTFTDLTATESGIWEIVADGNSSGTNPLVFNWNIQVQDGSTDIPGRVWALEHNASQLGGSKVESTAADFSLYYISKWGYLYEAAYTGYNGVNSSFLASAGGIREEGTCTSVEQSQEVPGASWTGLPDGLEKPSTDCGLWKLFFTEPADDLPAVATQWDGNTTWLVTDPKDPGIDDLVFTPDSTAIQSGTFTFDVSEFDGNMQILVDTDNNGSFTDAVDRTIDYGAVAGSNTVAFDGLDGQGNQIPATREIKAEAKITRKAEMHIDNLDVEMRTSLALTRLTGTDAPDSTMYWDDTALSTDHCSQTSVLDGTAGVDSSGGVHGWTFCGAASDVTGGSWGNNRAIEDWAYAEANAVDDVDIPARKGNLRVKKTSSVTEVKPGGTVTYTVKLTNDGKADFMAGNPATFTDDLTDVLDDAVYNNDAQADAGKTAYKEPKLDWIGELKVGSTATVTYTVTVNDPDTGDGKLTNVVVSEESPDCPEGSTDPKCSTTTEVRGLDIVKRANVSQVDAGGKVYYTISATNTGPAEYTEDDPASFTDDLTKVLDDAVYNDDAKTTLGSVSYAEPKLTWTGPLKSGQTVTVGYSVTVNDPDTGDQTLTNVVTSDNDPDCADADSVADDCTTTVTVQSFTIEKTSDVDHAKPGDTVTYQIKVTNSGDAAYTKENPALFSDDLTDVLDDATWNDNAAADAGVVTYVEPKLDWAGPIPAGGSVTITYSVTVNDPDTGDQELTNVVVGGNGNSNCAKGSTDDACTVTVPIGTYEVAKTVDKTGASPGDKVTYTVTVKNTGQYAYTAADPASFTDDLTAVLDDATYDNDADATAGTPSYAEPTLSWSGPLEVGATVTVTYSVTVNDPDDGDGKLTNVVVGGDDSTTCPAGSTDDSCTTTVPVQGLKIVKTNNATGPLKPGDKVIYTVAATNTGKVAYTVANPATFVDDLTAVLDDATYNNDAKASKGSVTYSEPKLTWKGPLQPGATATIVYSVTVNDPDTGDGTLTNTVVSDQSTNCQDGSTDADCVNELPVQWLDVEKSASVKAAKAGDTITYKIVAKNNSGSDYTSSDPARLTDDLTAVLDDANYNNDAVADPASGTISYTEPTLSWSGPLAAGSSVTITYTMTVHDPADGDGQLTNVVVSDQSSTCKEGSTDAKCSVTIPLRALEVRKVANEDEVAPGDTVRYTIVATNKGSVDYTADDPATFTDDLQNVLDDAMYNNDAKASQGSVSYTKPVLKWTGPIAASASVSITYTVTVNSPDTGDGQLKNTVVSQDSSNCQAKSTADECTVTIPVKSLLISKSSTPSSVAPGGTVTYTITAKNNGQVDFTTSDPASLTDDLTDVLDDATYNNDAAADPNVGSVSYASPNLTWSGPLAQGDTVTITYTVTVNDPDTGDLMLTNAVSSDDDGPGTCDDCSTDTPVGSLEISKEVSETSVAPGDTLTYTVTVKNNGETAYTRENPATFTDDLTDVLDDATYNNDAAADPNVGTVSYVEPKLTWSGPLAAGASVKVTYSVTVNDPDEGDGKLTNAVVGGDESTCPPDSTNPDCSTDVPVAGLKLKKTATQEQAEPGDTITYTVTATNTGKTDYTTDDPASFTDDLTKVLDDATYNNDAVADPSDGTLTYAEPVLSWSGPLAAGATVTITYTVTVKDPATGDGQLQNTVVSDDKSNCEEGSDDPDCQVTIPMGSLEVEKQASVTSAAPGDTVIYTVTVTNTGETAYTTEDPASFTDDLTDVLDDATYNNDAVADPNVGAVSYEEPKLAWSGPLAASASVTVTYSVAVNDPDTGDKKLSNVVVSDGSKNCPEGSTDPDCATDVPVTDAGLKVTKKASAGQAAPGDTVTYTITVANTGTTDYTAESPASFTDDMTDVLDDATYNNDAAADPNVGSVSYSQPVLSWSGPLAADATVTVTYSVTVNDPDTGDQKLSNTVVSPPSVNCQEGSTDADCTVDIPVREGGLEVKKQASVSEAAPGDTVIYTVTVTNAGDTAYTAEDPASFTDDLADVLDDATYNNDAEADPNVGTVAYKAPHLSWTGPLAAGDAVTVTYSVTVNDPDTGDKKLSNVVVSDGSKNCPEGSTDPDCTTDVPVGDGGLKVTKKASVTTAQPGDSVTYKITVSNTGETAYTDTDPAKVTDDLTKVLDDATYNNDAAADPNVGSVSYSEPALSWSGPLAVGGTVTITYSVTVNDPDTGDGRLTNVVVGEGSVNCPEGSTDPDCTVDIPVGGLEIQKVANESSAAPGDTVRYTITAKNTGAADYTAEDPASFTDDLTDVLDDATYNNDAKASQGDVTYAEPVLSWSGPIAAGASVSITYTVTVNSPDTGDGQLKNTVVGDDSANCPEGSTEPECTVTIPVKSLVISKSSTPSSVAPGGTVTYTITAKNNGQVDFTSSDPASLSDDLTDVLDDATYNNDAVADPNVGSLSYAAPMLTWSGPLAKGSSVTITYTVTVNDPDTGDNLLKNAVSSDDDGPGTCDDCSTETPVGSLDVSKQTSQTSVAPGGTVIYTVTVTNNGKTAYTDTDPASFTDDLTDVLDDATYNNDAAADPNVGTLSYAAPKLTWSGPLAAGASVTVTYSVTVNNPDDGDGKLKNAVVSPGTKCEEGSTDPACSTTVPVQSIHVVKSSTPATLSPGDTETYTVAVTNNGDSAYTAEAPASVTDDLTDVLDDATYNNDAAVDPNVGTVTYAAPKLTWSGPLDVGQTITITYSVTVNAADTAGGDTGDKKLTNTVVSDNSDNCQEGSTSKDCTTTAGIPGLSVEKTASAANVAPGDTLTYTVTVKNTGQIPFTDKDPATFTDDLTGVLDDATYNNDAAADPSVGTVTYAAPKLTWSGPLEAGATVTVTYSVTVNDPDNGDGQLKNAVVSDQSDKCPPDSTDPKCSTTTPVRDLDIEKKASQESAMPGDTVTYTITATNTGKVDFTDSDPASFVDNLSSVLDDATYNNDASATAGEVSYEQPDLKWSGPLAAGASVEVTYSVTVNDPDTGDKQLVNTVLSKDSTLCPVDMSSAKFRPTVAAMATATTESKVKAAATIDPKCTATVPVKSLHITKQVSPSGQVKPGDTLLYTITVANDGKADYAADDPARFADDLTDVLDDATYNDDAKATAGDVSYKQPILSWSGLLAVDASVSVTYTMTVNSPDNGDKQLTNVVSGGPETNCAVGSDDPDCSTSPSTSPPASPPTHPGGGTPPTHPGGGNPPGHPGGGNPPGGHHPPGTNVSSGHGPGHGFMPKTGDPATMLVASGASVLLLGFLLIGLGESVNRKRFRFA